MTFKLAVEHNFQRFRNGFRDYFGLKGSSTVSMSLVTEKMFLFIVVVQHSLYCKLLLFADIHSVIDFCHVPFVS